MSVYWGWCRGCFRRNEQTLIDFIVFTRLFSAICGVTLWCGLMTLPEVGLPHLFLHDVLNTVCMAEENPFTIVSVSVDGFRLALF